MISYKYLSPYFTTSECFPTFVSFLLERQHRRFDSACQTESYSCQVVNALVLKNEIWSSIRNESPTDLCFFFEKVVVLNVDHRSYPTLSILHHFCFYICLHRFQFCLHMGGNFFYFGWPLYSRL